MQQQNTHEIVILKPKPPASQICSMVKEFFEVESQYYDVYNEETPKRKLYIDGVNAIIARELEHHKPLTHVLSIAAGTGKREVDIRKLSNRYFEITCTDVSEAMCTAARQRGLNAFQGPWEAGCRLPDVLFDAAFYLLAFGLFSERAQRQQALDLASEALRKGALLFIDVLNLKDNHEWGPQIEKLFHDESLADEGYNLGDVFYRRTGKDEISFTHYFSDSEMKELLESAGFDLQSVLCIGYGQHTGQVLDSLDQGTLLFIARKQR